MQGQVNRGFVQGQGKQGDLEAQMSVESRRGGRRTTDRGQRKAAPVPGAVDVSFDGSSPEHLRKADGLFDLTIDRTINVIVRLLPKKENVVYSIGIIHLYSEGSLLVVVFLVGQQRLLFLLLFWKLRYQLQRRQRSAQAAGEKKHFTFTYVCRYGILCTQITHTHNVTNTHPTNEQQNNFLS